MGVLKFGGRSGAKSDGAILVLLAALAVAVPTVAFLWSVARAMENDSAARRQEQSDLFRLRLTDAKRAINSYLGKFVSSKGYPLNKLDELGAAEVFSRVAKRDMADGLVVFDGEGEVAFPRLAEHRNIDELTDVELEVLDVRDRYAFGEGDEGDRTRAGLRAIRKLVEPEQRTARNTRGRVIYPNLLLATLRGLERDHPRFEQLSSSLKRFVSNYGKLGASMPSAQRLFLAEGLAEIHPEFVLPVAEFEGLTALAMGRPSPLGGGAAVTRVADVDGVWSLASADGRFLFLFKEARLLRELVAVGEEEVEGDGLSLKLVPPSEGDHEAAGLAIPAGQRLPGWELHASSPGSESGAVTKSRRNFYIATAAMALALVGLFAWLAARGYIRHARETQLRNDFLSTVSHELRTPLTSTRMLVDTLVAGQYKDPERTKKYLDVIAQENARLSHLVETFLTYSRMERGKLKFDIQGCSPEDVATKAADSVRERFSAAGVDFDFEVAGDLPVIDADAETLSTALINLLDNAFKYTGAEKQIRFKVGADGGEVKFSVIDNGEGLSARDKKHVRDRFYRADSELARASGGSGLGLSIVSFIVEGHGGHLDIESEPGQGSTFTITIPAKH